MNKHGYIRVSPPTRRSRRALIRPIERDDFDELSPQELYWGNRLLGLLGVPRSRERLLSALAEAVSEILGMPHDLYFHSLRIKPGAAVSAQAGGRFSTTFLLPPDPAIGVLSADLNLVQSWLDALLRDEPVEARTIAPLSARDFGLVTYLLMEALNWLCQRGLAPLSLATQPSDLGLATQNMRHHAEVAEIVFAALNPIGAGHIIVHLPGAMLRSMELFGSQAAQLEQRRLELLRSRFSALHTAHLIEAGSASLSREEYHSLRPNDVVFLETLAIDGLSGPEDLEKRAALIPKFSPSGRVYLAGSAGDYLSCTLHYVEDTSRFEVKINDHLPRFSAELAQNALKTVHNRGETMESEQNNPSGEQQAHASLIEKAQVKLQFCIGSLRISVGELAQLQSGHVLELDRRLEEGVDLVVDGARVGNGELVWVENRLGVRLRSIEA